MWPLNERTHLIPEPNQQAWGQVNQTALQQLGNQLPTPPNQDEQVIAKKGTNNAYRYTLLGLGSGLIVDGWITLTSDSNADQTSSQMLTFYFTPIITTIAGMAIDCGRSLYEKFCKPAANNSETNSGQANPEHWNEGDVPSVNNLEQVVDHYLPRERTPLVR